MTSKQTPDEEAEDERIAIVADGCNVSQAEAERIVRGWREKAGRLDFTTNQGNSVRATVGSNAANTRKIA